MTPAFFIILLVTALLKSALKNKYVQAILKGMKPCVIGIVLATGIYMVISNCCSMDSEVMLDVRAVMITALLLVVSMGYKHFKKKKIAPMMLIVISAIAGVVVYRI